MLKRVKRFKVNSSSEGNNSSPIVIVHLVVRQFAELLVQSLMLKVKRFRIINLPLLSVIFVDIAKNKGGTSYVSLAVALYILGLFMILLELVVPHGITGFLGVAGILGGIILSIFTAPPIYTVIMGAFTVIVLPLLFYLVYKKMQLIGGLKEKQGDYSSTVSSDYNHLVGKQGIALSILRPSGIVLIDNKKVDAVSERDVIEKGEKVTVVKVEGIRIVVRKLTTNNQ